MRIANALGITDPADLVRIVYGKYGEDSVPLSASRENYAIAAEEALTVATKRRRPVLVAIQCSFRVFEWSIPHWETPITYLMSLKMTFFTYF